MVLTEGSAARGRQGRPVTGWFGLARFPLGFRSQSSSAQQQGPLARSLRYLPRTPRELVRGRSPSCARPPGWRSGIRFCTSFLPDGNVCLRGLRSTGGPCGLSRRHVPWGGRAGTFSVTRGDRFSMRRPASGRGLHSTPWVQEGEGQGRSRQLEGRGRRQSGTKGDVGTMGDPGTGRLVRLGAVHDVSGLGVGDTLFPPHPLRCLLAQMVASSPFLEVVPLVTETTCLCRAPGVHGVGRVCTSIEGQGLRPREAHRGCPGCASNPVQEAGAWGWHLARVERIM